jgi:hypothetical protein
LGLNERGRGKVPNAALPLSVYNDAARDVREALNSAVEGAGGEGYAEARRAYGALKEIEKDVGLAVGRSLKNPENKTSGQSWRASAPWRICCTATCCKVAG